MPLMFPKQKPALLDKQDRRKTVVDLDRLENEKVKQRSGGRCEIHSLNQEGVAVRCLRRAAEIHHLLGGWRRRSRGASALAEHKQHVCRTCHREITGHVLQHIGVQVPRWTDKYRRIS